MLDEAAKTNRPRILVTGFGPFPGAPVNPTEALIGELARRSDMAEVTFAVLPVDYAAAPGRLSELASASLPDIAIHFGLSARAHGFTLERLARNEIAAGRLDNTGRRPSGACIVEGGAGQPSTLPLSAIASALEVAALPYSFSDDAGGYLCNYVFYLSRSEHFPGFSPAMSGFVHVPPLAADAPDNPHAMSLEAMERGAAIIVGACREAWRKSRDVVT